MTSGNHSYLLHRNARASYPTAARGEGCYLFDTSGKRYLDASGGAAVSCLGHNHPAVIGAIKAQIDRFPFRPHGLLRQ